MLTEPSWRAAATTRSQSWDLAEAPSPRPPAGRTDAAPQAENATAQPNSTAAATNFMFGRMRPIIRRRINGRFLVRSVPGVQERIHGGRGVLSDSGGLLP